MKGGSHRATYVSGPSKVQGDYCLVNSDTRSFVKNIQILPSEKCITLHKLLVCNFI